MSAQAQAAAATRRIEEATRAALELQVQGALLKTMEVLQRLEESRSLLRAALLGVRQIQ
jgi:hypothetical protein